MKIRLALAAIVLGAAAILTGCGGSKDSAVYSIGGTLSGLTANGLVLSNGSETISPSANATTFTFARAAETGATYGVTVQMQPAGLNCVVTNATGIVGNSNVTSIGVNCAAVTYSIGGTITGLKAAGLVLINGSDTLPVAANAQSFTFATPLATGSPFAVLVQTQPAGATCTINNGAGTVAGANVTNIAIICATLTITWSFAGLDGKYPSSLIVGSDGILYGTTTLGGSFGNGTVFRLTWYGALTVIRALAATIGTRAAEGLYPYELKEGSNDTFFGKTFGNDVVDPFVFSITTAGAFTQLSPNNASYRFNLQYSIRTKEGDYFAAHSGQVVRINVSSNTSTTLAPFTLGTGEFFNYDLRQLTDGNFYGTTNTRIFRLSELTGALTTIATFPNPPTGAFTSGDRLRRHGVVEDVDGNLYGSVSGPNGVAGGYGYIYKATPAGVFQTLHTFNGAADGAGLVTALTRGNDGNFYGLTSAGGANNLGTMFRITAGGALTVLYSFKSADKIWGPVSFPFPAYSNECDISPPVQYQDGSFFFTTGCGGYSSAGSVVRLSF